MTDFILLWNYYNIVDPFSALSLHFNKNNNTYVTLYIFYFKQNVLTVAEFLFTCDSEILGVYELLEN